MNGSMGKFIDIVGNMGIRENSFTYVANGVTLGDAIITFNNGCRDD